MIHDNEVQIDIEKWQDLTNHLKERLGERGMGQNCDVANALTQNFIQGALVDEESYSKLPRELQLVLDYVMHAFAHYCFEYGRQFQLDSMALPDNFDDLSVEDL